MQTFDRTARNVLANITGGAGLTVLSLIFNYLYYRLMGDEAYGLVAWFLMLTSIVSLLDFGMCRTTFRELARRSTSKDLAASSRSVVMTFQLVQWCAFVALGGVIVALSPLLANWLITRTLSHETVVTCIALSGMCISIAQPRNLYLSGLNGLGRQVTSNLLQGCFAALRGLTTLGVLKFYDPGIVTFFIVQLVGFAIETLITAAVLWRALPPGPIAPRPSILTEVKGYAGADGVVLVATVILTTGDKAVISRTLPLDQFGQYGLITLVCLTLAKLTAPFATAYFHVFTIAWQERNYRFVSRQYLQVSEIVNPLLIAGGLVFVLFAFEIMALLTGSRAIAESVELPMQLYALGAIFYSLQFIPHMLQLAAGWATLAMRIYAVADLVYIPALYVATPKWGLVAPPALWLAINFVIFPVLVHLMHGRLLPEVEIAWIKKTLVWPAIICSVLLFATRAALRPADTTAGMVGELTLVGFAAAISIFLSSGPVRTWTRFAAANVVKSTGVTRT
jgi:O-antigen/teichoic acid export membrane protein